MTRPSYRPDLAEFIARHATPYDSETDTYRRPPFAQPVKAGKNSPIHNAHSYHTKTQTSTKPSSVWRPSPGCAPGRGGMDNERQINREGKYSPIPGR